MKKKLIVVDFDKTLVPFDSFREYVFLWIRNFPLQISYLILLRKLRLISSKLFKKKFLIIIKKHVLYNDVNEAFSKKILKQKDENLWNKIQSMLTNNDVVLILSASPDDYILCVGKLLNVNAKGSYFDTNNNFVHIYAKSKIEYIEYYYPKTKYNYYYSVSDSRTDLELLQMFESYDLI